jgi:hypothetical protein
MTAHIEKRVEALEVDATRADHNLQVVIAEPGETAQQARQRLGIDSDADSVLVVMFG